MQTETKQKPTLTHAKQNKKKQSKATTKTKKTNSLPEAQLMKEDLSTLTDASMPLGPNSRVFM